MSRKTKTVIPTIFLAALMMGLWSIIAMRPSTNGKDPTQDDYLLSVKFDPPFTITAVIINVSVDGVPLIPNLDRHLSPWNETMTAQRGALVTLRAVSLDTADLDCYIMRNGVPLDHQTSPTGFGTVNCTTMGK